MFTLFCLGVFAQKINRESSQKKIFVKGYWNVLKGALLEATDRSFGWTKAQRDIEKRH